MRTTLYPVSSRLGALLLPFVLVLALAAPAIASSATVTLPNGCRITANNSYSNNSAVASTHKVAGYMCYKIQVRFQYFDGASGTMRWVDSLYQNAPSVWRAVLTPVEPHRSHHNGQATRGGTKWGFALRF